MADAFRRAVTQLARLPGVGEKTATRFVWWILKQDAGTASAIADALVQLRATVRECGRCHDISEGALCRRCNDARRDVSLVCVVERPQDVSAIDSTGEYRGMYHVLHGSLSPLDGVGPNDLRIRELVARLADVREVILATDPDVEGDTTALYLARLIRPLGVRVTRLAHGISVGTEIEFADRVSLARAFEGRREM